MAVEITSKEELEEWLDGKPPELAGVILERSAVRVSLAALVVLDRDDNDFLTSTSLSLLRLASLASATLKIPTDELLHERARAALEETSKSDIGASDTIILGVARHIAFSAIDAHFLAQSNYFSGSILMDDAYLGLSTNIPDPLRIWKDISVDCSALDDLSSVRLNNRILVYDEQPAKLWLSLSQNSISLWGAARRLLSATDAGFEIWREWYYGRIEGLPHAFADFDHAADEKFYRWIVEQNNDWWSREPAEVNREITEFVDALRKPKAEPPESSLPSETQTATAPIFTLGNSGQLALDQTAAADTLKGHEAREPLRKLAKARVTRLGELLKGDNNAPSFSPICDKITTALGNEWLQVEPYSLILETQSLRKALQIQQSYGPKDEWNALDGEDLQAADDATSALNTLIGSVDFLENIETKRLGPDHTSPLSTPGELIEVADVLKVDEITEAPTDHLIRVGADNAPDIPDPDDRTTTLAVDMGLNLVRASINLFVEHEKEVTGLIAGGTLVSVVGGMLTAGVMATGSVLAGGAGLAWWLARNITKNRDKWRAIAKSSDRTAKNLETLIEKLDALPLE